MWVFILGLTFPMTYLLILLYVIDFFHPIKFEPHSIQQKKKLTGNTRALQEKEENKNLTRGLYLYSALFMLTFRQQ